MDEIADAINRHVVPLLFEFNPGFRSEQGGPLTALPTVEHGDVETPDLAELGAYLSALTLTGVDLTDTETQAFLRRAAGLPERPADEEAAARPVAPEPEPDDPADGEPEE